MIIEYTTLKNDGRGNRNDLFYGKSQNARDFSHEMNDVCNWFSAVSIREP